MGCPELDMTSYFRLVRPEKNASRRFRRYFPTPKTACTRPVYLSDSDMDSVFSDYRIREKVSTCDCKSLSWTVSIKDEYDLDNIRYELKQIPRNIVVLMIKIPNATLTCGWHNFWHIGSKSGIETW